MEKYAFMFRDRADAGRRLADLVAKLELDDPLIYALPRGGVPVAVEIARRLHAPIDLMLVRKIGAPHNPEVALGAIVEGPTPQVVINEDVLKMSGADMGYLESAYSEQIKELDRRKDCYLGNRERLNPEGRTVVVVDDGLATGATMKAGLIGLRRNGAERIVVALPVAPESALKELEDRADDIICLHPAKEFRGVGAFYGDFHQLTDEETIGLLGDLWNVSAPVRPDAKAEKPHVRQVTIPPLGLAGELTVPKNPRGIVVFAHGSGSSRKSPRNTWVASHLNAAGFATLLFDLLNPTEGEDRRNVFDIELLAERVVEAVMWVASEPEIDDLPLGLFGASTGAAAALVAAAELKDRVSAVVSRGGRPDLAGAFLPKVKSPTMLIVGGLDTDVIALNKWALSELTCEKDLQIVPGAGHLFEQAGTLDKAVEHARAWFEKHLSTPSPVRGSGPVGEKKTVLSILKTAAEPLPDLNDPAFAKAFDRFADCKVVLLGESTHGTSEFYRARAAITRHLIEQHGFSVVAVEADWPDAATVDRYIRRSPHRPAEMSAFQRFPTWMWRNTDFESFVRYLHEHNHLKPPAERVAFYGLDLYNMNASIDAVLRYLDGVDTAAARVARERYACLSPWSREPSNYGRAALTHGFALCEKAVTGNLVDLLKKKLDYMSSDGEAYFDASQNARLVANAERYYRAMYYGSHVSWNLRDSHMFDTLKNILDHAGPEKKAVVWAHNSHVGDARETAMGQSRGELNIGQLCREAFGTEAALIGFSTASGTVAAASEWDAPMEIKTIRPPRPDSFEALCQSVDLNRFMFDFSKEGNDDLRRCLAAARLERYIGVIYRPETERASHYSHSHLSRQYDALVWLDRTNAVSPLPTIAREGGDDTYPFGL